MKLYGLISHSFLALCLLMATGAVRAQIQGDFPLDFPTPSFGRLFKQIEEMEKRFFGDRGDFFKDFERHFGMGRNSFSQGRWSEDEKHKIFVIKGVLSKENPLKISVKEGQVTVEGTLKQHQKDKRQIYRFSQQFPAPEGTDPTRVKIENKAGEVHLLFPKVAPKITIPPNKRHTPPGTRPLKQREGETRI